VVKVNCGKSSLLLYLSFILEQRKKEIGDEAFYKEIEAVIAKKLEETKINFLIC